MKRKNIHLTEQQIEGLKILSEQRGLKPAELVRRAVDKYLAANIQNVYEVRKGSYWYSSEFVRYVSLPSSPPKGERS